MSKRTPIILLAVAALLVVGGLYWMSGSDSGRTDRRSRLADGRENATTESTTAEVETASGPQAADAATVAKLIEQYGGFTTSGAAVLTRPTAPGTDLEVLLKTNLDGHLIEGRVRTDAEGRFAIPQLPRATGYVLTIDGEAVQTFRQEVAVPTETAVELGDLYIDRYYFLNGKVVSSSGVAVPNVEVAAILPNNGQTGFSMRGSATNAAVADYVSASTTTAGDGTFTIRLEDPGILYLRARAEGWAPHYRPDVYVGAGAETDITLSLTRGVEVAGVVLGRDGRPASEVVVSLFPNSRRWWSQVKELQTTGSDGRFSFRIEPRTNRYSVRVTPKDGVDLNRNFRLPLEEDLVIQLPGGATLKGRVIDVDTTQPIANAEIILMLRGPGGNQWVGAYQKAIKTDSYGVFRLEGVGIDGMHSVAVSAPGYANFMGNQWTRNAVYTSMRNVKFEDGREAELPDIPLKRGRVVEGVVRDIDTQEPIRNATVTVNDMMMGARPVQTGPDGRYRVTDIGDRVSLSVKAEGYVEQADNPWRGVELAADQEIVQRDFELAAASGIEGRVTTGEGSPVRGALVRLQPASRGRGNWMAGMRLRELYTHTDSNGRFRIDGVPPMKVKAEATLAGFESGESGELEVVAGTDTREVDIKLVSSATLTGMVVAREGGVVEGARIVVAKDPGNDGDDRMRRRWMSQGTPVFTDSKGRFRAVDVPSGDIVLYVEAEGLAMQTMSKKGVAPGSEVKGMKVTMKPALVITGKVLNESGEPMTRAWVRATLTGPTDGESSTQATGARVREDGTFEVTRIPEGSYELEVRTWGWGENRVEYEPLKLNGIAAGTKDVVLQLKVKE
ncbi:MAG: carboxypeptidase-like regulatory domain-containing protein [Planctomycetota bacterium]